MRPLDRSPAKLRKYRQRILVIMAVFLMLIVFLGFNWPDYQRQIESIHWPTAPGIITESQLKSAYVRSQGAHAEAGHYADVRYRYMVGESAFLGEHLSFDQSLKSEEAARSELEAFPAGKRVDVYYSPANPRVAVLLPGLQGQQRRLLCLGIGLTALLTLLFCAMGYFVHWLNRELRLQAARA